MQPRQGKVELVDPDRTSTQRLPVFPDLARSNWNRLPKDPLCPAIAEEWLAKNIGSLRRNRGFRMPVGRYFLFVGSALLSLLFLADAYLPKPPASPTRAEIDKSSIRIKSANTGPMPVVIEDTGGGRSGL
jgi:hypothetical protein